MHKSILTVLAAAACSAAAAAQDPEALQKAVKALTERVDELEEQQLKMADRVGDRALAQAYTAQSLDIGGHVTSLFTSIHGDDTTATGHLVSLIELYLKARMDEQWSLFATPGFYAFNGGLVDDPVTTTITGDPVYIGTDTGDAGLFLSRLYGQCDLGDVLTLQGGIVGSPHGTTNREYFIPSRVIAAGNLHTRYFLLNQLYPQQILGGRASGKLAVGDNRVEYDAYFGGEDNSPSDSIGGARCAYVFTDLGLSIAGNYGRGTREGFPAGAPTSEFPFFTANVAYLQAPFNARYNLTRDYEFGGVDVELRHGDFITRTEAYYSAEEDVEDQRAFSQEVNWFLHPTWAASYRFDYHDAGADLDALGIAVGSLGHATEHVVGVCFSPNDSVRLRLDLHHLLLPNTNDTVDFLNLSWSLSF